ncbi:MAG: hypothetical protein QMC35_09700 [Polaribacter sp.]
MNFTYYDPKKIANSDPTKPAQDDNFYILGSSKQLPENLAKDYSNGSEKGQELENLTDALSKIGLLPSQNSNTIPPIVLLTSGDILIQKPEEKHAYLIVSPQILLSALLKKKITFFQICYSVQSLSMKTVYSVKYSQ